ncbi:MAG TPA: hypothetical protein VF954_07755 [Acidimicrobiales bacterium]
MTRRDDGTGLIATVFGVAVFLLFLLLGVQVVFDLYARTTVTAAAYDAAHTVAGADAGATPAAQAEAEQRARDLLGSYGRRVRFRWSLDPDTVALTVQVHNPSLLPAMVAGPLGIDTIDRTVVLRREAFR